jgi:hypothetical protein
MKAIAARVRASSCGDGPSACAPSSRSAAM